MHRVNLNLFFIFSFVGTLWRKLQFKQAVRKFWYQWHRLGTGQFVHCLWICCCDVMYFKSIIWSSFVFTLTSAKFFVISKCIWLLGKSKFMSKIKCITFNSVFPFFTGYVGVYTRYSAIVHLHHLLLKRIHHWHTYFFMQWTKSLTSHVIAFSTSSIIRWQITSSSTTFVLNLMKPEASRKTFLKLITSNSWSTLKDHDAMRHFKYIFWPLLCYVCFNPLRPIQQKSSHRLVLLRSLTPLHTLLPLPRTPAKLGHFRLTFFKTAS